ncbi:hypothetical protein KP509_31G050800 [Ceratopteris richardii]|uniref:Uncharacterized protein n=1 Tax=Ceratopteris richardii TaxID=49495 RepID=A0A8T2QXX1_CERRI|nr:hypothetical protein KP509_31G050800 [Ceratopteris richardii]
MAFSLVAKPDASHGCNPHEETPLERLLREQVEIKCGSKTLNIINRDSMPLLHTAMLQCSANALPDLESPRTGAIRKKQKQERVRRSLKIKRIETIRVTQDDFIRSVLEHTSMIDIPPVMYLTASDPSAAQLAPEGQDVNSVPPLDDIFFRHLGEFVDDMTRGLL